MSDRLSVSGQLSASSAMVSSVRTWSSAKVCAPALDPVLNGGRRTVTPRSRATSPVPSVEQSSTTMISTGATVCALRLRIVSAMEAASLYAGTMTVTGAVLREALARRAAKLERAATGFPML